MNALRAALLLIMLLMVGCGGGSSDAGAPASGVPQTQPPGGGSGGATDEESGGDAGQSDGGAGEGEGASPPPGVTLAGCSGGSAPAGDVASYASFADLAAALEPGRWAQIPDTRLEQVFPPQAGHPGWGVLGPSAVTSSSGGAAYDADRRLLILTGGGGDDYGGNEVYHFSLDTLSWERATEPSTLTEVASGKYAVDDGSEAPSASKTYDGLLYMPSVQRMFKFGGAYYKSASYDRHAYLYDPVARTWTRGAALPEGINSSTLVQPTTAYDPNTGRALVGFYNGLLAYDPVTDAWSTVSGNNNQNFGRVSAFDPLRRQVVQSDPGGTSGDLAYFTVDGPVFGRQWASVDGPDDFNASRAAGIAYHAPSDRFVLWGGDREVWTVDAQNWTSRKFENPNGHAPLHLTNGGARQTAGIYGRWQYVEEYDVFIGYPHSTENVWVYKLPAADHVEVAVPDDCGCNICVGPTWQYAKPSQAAAVVQAGQSVGIAAGEYEDCASWPVSVWVQGVGGRAHIRDKTCEGKGVFVTKGEQTVIRNIELSGATGDANAAGIRHEGKLLVVQDAVIHSNRMGILTGHGLDVALEVYDSLLYGQTSNGALAHNIYAGKIGRFVAKGNEIRDPYSGHLLKTVARENIIEYNRLIDDSGTEASLIDIWGCSESTVLGNTLFKRDTTGGLYFVALVQRTEYGSLVPCPDEQARHAYIAYNTGVFTHPTQPTNKLWSAFVINGFGTPYVTRNNLSVNTWDFEFRNSAHLGLGDHGGDVHLTTPAPELFVDFDARDLRLAVPLRDTTVTSEQLPDSESRPGGGTHARDHVLDVGSHAHTP